VLLHAANQLLSAEFCYKRAMRQCECDSHARRASSSSGKLAFSGAFVGDTRGRRWVWAEWADKLIMVFRGQLHFCDKVGRGLCALYPHGSFSISGSLNSETQAAKAWKCSWVGAANVHCADCVQRCSLAGVRRGAQSRGPPISVCS
jgi:hypothetical protein